MLDHVGINCTDLATSAAFYDKVLGALGFARVTDFGQASLEAVCHTAQPGDDLP